MTNVSDDEQINSTEESKKNLAHYRNVLDYMGANIPVAALCLPSVIENTLLRNGYERAYDLLGKKLTEIPGIGKDRAIRIATSLDEFFTVQI